MEENKTTTRREFLISGARLSLTLALGSLAGLAALHASGANEVWQIDPFKCTQCGRCADYCVKSPSAVKCIDAFDLCGYCDYCTGYFKPGNNALTTAGENQLCPTSALTRNFIEEPFFEYRIIEDLCIGCAKCVKGCTAFGNGSLHLQIMHHLCDNCNQCSIARVCPSDAIQRVKVSNPYQVKGSFTKEG
jgi:Na+-translocating ferredoxin:NAD+ oxidoreductase subunit B